MLSPVFGCSWTVRVSGTQRKGRRGGQRGGGRTGERVSYLVTEVLKHFEGLNQDLSVWGAGGGVRHVAGGGGRELELLHERDAICKCKKITNTNETVMFCAWYHGRVLYVPPYHYMGQYCCIVEGSQSAEYTIHLILWSM